MRKRPGQKRSQQYRRRESSGILKIINSTLRVMKLIVISDEDCFDTSVKEVPKEATYNGFAIGYWYSNLKISRKNHSLSESQLADITAINPDFR